MIDLFASLLLMSGAGFILIAAIGALRLPDVLCRSHAVAKASTLGIFSMLLGLWLELGTEAVGFKVVLAILFQVATIPAAGHLVSLLARQKNLPQWQRTSGDASAPAAPQDGPARR
jgi:multicomponent Na+:H+ antiporter subunit G